MHTGLNDALLRYVAPLLLLIPLAANMWGLVHSHLTIPKTFYFAGLQTAFGLNILSILVDMVHFELYFSGTFVYETWILHNVFFTLHLAVYLLAQMLFFTQFFTRTKQDTSHLVIICGIIVGIITSITLTVYFMRLVQSTRVMYLKYMYTGCLTTIASLDVIGSGLILYGSVTKYPVIDTRIPYTLIGIYVISVMDFGVGYTLTFLQSQHKMFYIAGDVMDLVYMPLSYSCMVGVQKLIKGWREQYLKNDVSCVDENDKMESSPVIGVVSS